jgi:tRNA G18 (ribose-2'-O)-methylase SpoU
MPVLRINGPRDPRVDAYHVVQDPELVRQRGLFVAEGRLVVERLITERRFTIQSMLLSERALRALEPVLSTLAPAPPVFVCAAGDFHGITGYDVHRGCLALAERAAPPSLDAVLEHARTVVVLEGVSDAGNVGGLFRNAAAFGVDAVLLDSSSCDPLYRKAIRTSMAATLRVPFVRLANETTGWSRALVDLKARGFTLVALTPSDAACDLLEFATSEPPARLALVVGAEGDGLTAESLAAADHQVRIPIRPEVDSLNVAVAAGIALHALLSGPPARQGGRAGYTRRRLSKP